MASDSYADWRQRLGKVDELWPIEAIDQEWQANRAQFWCCGDAALMTRVVHYPGGARVCETIAAAGTMDGLVERIAPQVEQWARENGLTHLMIAGRKGWQRVHKWRLHQTILIKDLA